jgi:hypothetical protein
VAKLNRETKGVNGKHLAEDSVLRSEDAARVVAVLVGAFPASEGIIPGARIAGARMQAELPIRRRPQVDG